MADDDLGFEHRIRKSGEVVILRDGTGRHDPAGPGRSAVLAARLDQGDPQQVMARGDGQLPPRNARSTGYSR